MTFGKAKFVFERWRNYLGIIGLLLAIRMNVLLSPINWWWFIVVFLISLIALYLDMRFIVMDESGTSFKKNTEWIEMKKLLEEIKDKIK